MHARTCLAFLGIAALAGCGKSNTVSPDAGSYDAALVDAARPIDAPIGPPPDAAVIPLACPGAPHACDLGTGEGCMARCYLVPDMAFSTWVPTCAVGISNGGEGAACTTNGQCAQGFGCMTNTMFPVGCRKYCCPGDDSACATGTHCGRAWPFSDGYYALCEAD